MSQWYFNYQVEPEGEWFPALATAREKTLKDKQPPFTTILDVDKNLKRDSTPEENAEARYRGPFYIDLDSNDVGEVIEQYKKLLRKLRNEYEIELDQLQLFATGGRGFHILIPQAIFMEKPNLRGVPYLPYMYKEMAMEMYVDTLDLNIYSMKRGRMFRTTNVQRTNGRYKVPITLQESFDMTEELYVELTSAPRHIQPASTPTYAPNLGLLYATSADKIGDAVKARKDSKADANLLAQFGDKMPPTLSAVMEGMHLKEGVGFQKIATQLAITANALNMSLEDFLNNCRGLIQNHVGDGSRYGTPAKRKYELQRMYHYMQGNPCYVFSVGGIKALMEKDYKTTDLDYGGVEVPEEAGEDEMQFSVSQGINVTERGIFKKVEGVIMQASALGMANPKQLRDLITNEVHGYEVDVFIDGKKITQKIIGMDAFASRNAFLKFTLSAASCNIGLTDAQIGALADIMRVRTEKSGKQVYTVRREGIDVIVLPDGRLDVVWADKFGVGSRFQMNYRLTGSMTEDLQFRTDLRQAPALIDTEDTRTFFDNLFKINKQDAVGRMLGFYMSNFLCQPIRHLFGKYPYLQVFGPAGSGKSETNRLMANLHYFKSEIVTASALDSTKFVYEEMATCSGSIPFIVDEYKPREMRRDLYEKLKGILRSNYGGDRIGKGSVQSSTGASKLVLTQVSNRSPIVTIGEAIEPQSALRERSVLVPLTKEGRKGRRDPFVYCQEHRMTLAHLGRAAIDKARAVDLDVLRAQINTNINLVRDVLGNGEADDKDRPLFNIAVMLLGLDFCEQIMAEVFGDRYTETFAEIRNSVLTATDSLVPKVKSEAAKVLDVIAFMSWSQEQDEKLTLFYARDFVVDPAMQTVDLNLRNCYNKYARLQRSTGEESLYDSYEAFYSAMENYHGTMDTVTPNSPLKESATTTVFRFKQEALTKDGVGLFKV